MPAPPGRRRPRSLALRIVFGVLVASLSLLLISLGGLPLTCYAVFVASVALHEFYALAEAKGHNPARKTGIIGGVVIALGGMYLTEAGMHTTVMWLTIAVYLAFLFGRAENSTMVDVGITQLGTLYVTWGFAHILLLRRLDMGPPIALAGHMVSSGLFYTWILAWTTAMCDVGCFAFGSMFGRHKLCPSISPNKTVEGSLGGLLTSVGVALAWSLPAGLPWLQPVVIGLAAGLAAQLGDLWESVLKRDAGVKDAGKLIPGHGGMLDRFDSFFFATPVVYYLVKYVVLTYHLL